MPKLSVIVPEHNSAEWMRKGLESIRRQTFQDYQLIVICDRCEDNTYEIASGYMRLGDAVERIDAGCCAAARNRGLELATGEWILFMDDDDWFDDDDAFRKIAERAGKEGEDILAFGFNWQHIGYKMPSPQRLYTAVWCKAWRREFIELVGARFPLWKHSDDEGFCRQTHHLAKIAFLNEYLYYYNFRRPGSITWQIENGMMDRTIPAE